VANIWRQDKYNVKQRHREQRNNTLLDEEDVSGDYQLNSNKSMPQVETPKLQDDSNTNKWQVEVENNNEYAISHAPIILHQEPRQTRSYEKLGLSYASCFLKFGPKPHAYQCSVCNKWYHKKKCFLFSYYRKGG
jgi:hypothetical protein